MRSVMAISWVLGACLLAATALAEPGEEADADLGADADADADDSAVEVTEVRLPVARLRRSPRFVGGWW